MPETGLFIIAIILGLTIVAYQLWVFLEAVPVGGA